MLFVFWRRAWDLLKIMLLYDKIYIIQIILSTFDDLNIRWHVANLNIILHTITDTHPTE